MVQIMDLRLLWSSVGNPGSVTVRAVLHPLDTANGDFVRKIILMIHSLLLTS